MKHKGEPSKADCDLEVDICVGPADVRGEYATVKAGERIGLLCDAQLWGPPGCDGKALVWIVVGIEGEPVDATHEPAYPYPGVGLAWRSDVNAPSTPGKYRVQALVVYGPGSRDDAMKYYREHPELRFTVAELAVAVGGLWPLMLLAGFTPIIFVGGILASQEAVK